MNSKAQVFTLDAFLSLLLVTISLGLLVTQTETITSQADHATQTLASDFAQIAVKNVLVYNEPNNLTTQKMSNLKNLMDETFSGTVYSYEVEAYNGTILSIKGNSDCSNSKESY